MENMMNNSTFEIPSFNGINQIDLHHEQLVDYRDTIINLIQIDDEHLQQVVFYKRYKHQFITYHSVLYDKKFRCCSYIISYTNNDNNRDGILYGKIIVFIKFNNEYFAFIQRYHTSKQKNSDFVEIPNEIAQKLDELYPLLQLSNDYDIISVQTFRHKCIAVQFQDVFCLSEIRVDFEHD